MPKVFISYAWNDGATLARQLYEHFNHTPGWSAWMELELHAESVFSHALQNRINEADVVVVVISPEVNRREPPSFVQRELVYATQDGVNKPVFAAKAHDCPVPLIIAGVTFERFFPTTRFEEAFTALIQQIEHSPKHLTFTTTDPRELELAYLREVARQNGFFGKVYVETAAETRVQPPRPDDPVEHDPEVDVYLDQLLAAIHPPDQHSPEDDGRTGEVKTFAALSEALGEFDRVAIIGDPGSGETTTLRRFAYALGDKAAHDPTAPLPIFVPLGGYTGGDLSAYIELQFGGLRLRDCLPNRAIILLDGLNETTHTNVAHVLSHNICGSPADELNPASNGGCWRSKSQAGCYYPIGNLIPKCPDQNGTFSPDANLPADLKSHNR